MNCFPCFSSQKGKKESNSKKDHDFSFHPEPHPQPTEHVTTETTNVTPANYDTASSIKAFNFRELLSATKNFRQEFLLGEGSQGKLYKGTLQGKEVAVKQLDKNAMEENNEFFVEVGQLGLLQHSNLVSLIGYCNDGDQRLLVYEFMSGGSLEDYLHGTKAGEKPLEWVTRMKIAYGAAEGLQYLHEKAKPAVVYRDLHSSKILLDDELNPKLSNVGLDRLGSSAETKMHMQDNVGYNAPEFTNSGTVSTMTDIYSFGVVLLELISGRKPLDLSKPQDQQSLVDWAQPIFKEPKHFPDMADPLLKKRFPAGGLNQAVAIAAMCVQEEATARPMISDLASVLSFLSIAKEENNIPATLPPNDEARDEDESDDEDEEGSTSGSSDEETDQPNNGDGNGNHSLSQKSSGRSLLSVNNDSGRSANSMSHRNSKNSASYASRDNEGDDDDESTAAPADDDDESTAAPADDDNESTAAPADDDGDDDESTAAPADGDDDVESTAAPADDDDDDESTAAASSKKKTKKKVVDESSSESLGKRSSKKSEKTKNRKSSKKKKNKDESSKSRTKKSRHKTKKRSDNDDLGGESQSQN